MARRLMKSFNAVACVLTFDGYTYGDRMLVRSDIEARIKKLEAELKELKSDLDHTPRLLTYCGAGCGRTTTCLSWDMDMSAFDCRIVSEEVICSKCGLKMKSTSARNW